VTVPWMKPRRGHSQFRSSSTFREGGSSLYDALGRGSLDRLTLSAGDAVALLKGTRLDMVARTELDGITSLLLPSARGRSHQLLLKTAASTARLDPEKHYAARVC